MTPPPNPSLVRSFILDDRAASGRQHATAAVLTVLGLIASFLVYRPDRHLPFDVLDFSEFLPLLRGATSAHDQLRDVVSYYASQGRFNVVAYAAAVLKWNLLGDNSQVWQWFRFATMWFIVVLTYLLLRRLRTSRSAAAIGASVFLFAPPAAQGWIRLTMGEPLGTILLVVLCFVALADAPRWTERRVGATFAILCATVVLLKELLVPTLLFPLVLVAASDITTPTVARSRRLRTLMVSGAAAITLAAVPVAMVALRARSDAYASEFGAHLRSVGDAVAAWLVGLFPFEPFSTVPGPIQGTLDVAFILLLIIGWSLRARTNSERSRAVRLLAIGLVLLPFIGGVSYLPWPVFARFYAIPYLLSLSLLLALGLSAIELRSTRWYRGALFIWFACLIAGASTAFTEAARAAAGQRLNAHVASAVTSDARLDSFFVASPALPRLQWVGLGATLARYARVMAGDAPPTRDVTCQGGDSLLRRLPPRSVLMSYSSLCIMSRNADSLFVEHFAGWRWSLAGPGLDSIYVSVYGPDAR